MALSAAALTTLNAANDELGLVTAEDATRDTRIERYIEAASSLASSYCRRRFHYVSGIVEKHPTNGAQEIWLRQAPLKTLTTVKVFDTEIDISTLLEQRKNWRGEVNRLYRQSGFGTDVLGTPGVVPTPAMGTETLGVEVTYDGGYVTPDQHNGTTLIRDLPYDLEDAVILLVVSRFRSKGHDRRVVSKSFEAGTLNFGGEPVPNEIRGVLDMYRLEGLQ